MKTPSIKMILMGGFGSIMCFIFGPWTTAFQLLLVFMGIDYVTGILCAAIFHNSPKTNHGGLSSSVGLKGIIRKVLILIMVAIAHLLDTLSGTNFLRDAVIITYICNESISILENMGEIGIPIPKKIKDAIEILRRDDEE